MCFTLYSLADLFDLKHGFPLMMDFPYESIINLSRSPDVKTYLWAGGPSMMILIHRICMALRGLGSRKRVDRAIRVRAAMLLEHKTSQLVAWLLAHN